MSARFKLQTVQLLTNHQENKTWKEICIAVEKLTGEKTTASVLRPRQWRLKANIMVVSDEDQQRLLASKEIVDMRIEKERWNMIAEEMQKQGSEKYTVCIETIQNLLQIGSYITYREQLPKSNLKR